jgi:hypothetical protein
MNAQDQIAISELVYKSLDNNITPQECEQLNHYVVSDPQAAAFYVKTVQLHWGLRKVTPVYLPTQALTHPFFNTLSLQELAMYEKIAPSIEPAETPEQSPAEVFPKLHHQSTRSGRKINKSSILSFIVSAAATLLIILFVRFAPVKREVLVGKCTSTVNAVGESASGTIFPGCDLYSGPMSLTAGYAEIELEGGTIVIVEAPAQLTFESPSRLYVQEGRLVVKISNDDQGEPFVVRSPYSSIVDYGTEFGVQVDAVGNTLTHVYQGKVELRSGSNPLRFEHRMVLTRDQGGLADVQGRLISKPGHAGQFVRRDEFQVKVMASKGSAYHRWLDYSYQLRRDPTLAAYYTFERDDKNPAILTNLAEATLGILDGTLSSIDNTRLPSWVTGRWSQKTALLFDRTQNQFVEIASHPAININGPITIAAWVDCSGRNDGGHVVSNRIALGSFSNYQLGYRNPVYPDWKQGMHLARKANSLDAANQMYSKPLPEVAGWILIAVTHDNDMLKFYLNGELVDSKSWPHKQPLSEGGLMIGSDYSPSDPARFNGKIDEIVIAKRVFTEEEIAEMYEAGKP